MPPDARHGSGRVVHPGWPAGADAARATPTRQPHDTLPEATAPAGGAGAIEPRAAERPRVRVRTALVHHWLVGVRGGEKVLDALCELLPDADVFTLACDRSALGPALQRRQVTTSFVQRLPLARRRFRAYLPLFPYAAEQFDLRGYDLVVSSDANVVKGVLAPPDAPHVCYCHTPPRYLWDLYHAYAASHARGVVGRALLALVAHRLRRFDFEAAQRVDHFVANSRHVAARIGRHYRRSARVIHPPVETAYFGAARRNPQDFYLFVSELVPYKRADLAIAALSAMNRPLVVVGDGPMRRRLARHAVPSVRFLGRVSDDELREQYVRCRALVFPAEEDFGIVPVEAQAAGAPVIAYGRGGATESVVDGETGVLFAQQTPESLRDAVERFERCEASFEPARCREQVRQFDRSVFLRKMAALLEDVLAGRNGTTPAQACDAGVIAARA